jgi:phosphoribosylformylglycinamidine synthase
LLQDQDGGTVPRVDPELGLALFRAVHAAIKRGLVRACHDLSEGGLAVALAEMALAGGLGARVSLRDVPREASAAHDAALLFSESPSRFLLEVRPEHVSDLGRLGAVAGAGHDAEGVPPPASGPPRLTVMGIQDTPVIEATVPDLKAAWQRPLRW